MIATRRDVERLHPEARIVADVTGREHACRPVPMGHLSVGDRFVDSGGRLLEVTGDCASNRQGWLFVRDLTMTDDEVAALVARPGAVPAGEDPREGIFAASYRDNLALMRVLASEETRPTQVDVIGAYDYLLVDEWHYDKPRPTQVYVIGADRAMSAYALELHARKQQAMRRLLLDLGDVPTSDVTFEEIRRLAAGSDG